MLARIVALRRIGCSTNGNPRWEVVYKGATGPWPYDHIWAKTQSDASISYKIGNPGLRAGDLVELTLTKSGRISGMVKA
jgi:hypothetical protein